MGIRCSVCGKEHVDTLPDLGLYAPDPYLAVPPEERDERTTFTEDLCTVRDEDGTHYFVRGVIYIPIIGQRKRFGIGAWVSQSRENFDRYYSRTRRSPPTYGWLVNRIPHYAESTLLLKARLVHQGKNLRPWIELEPTDHPLAVDQRTGITLARAWQIVHRYLPN